MTTSTTRRDTALAPDRMAGLRELLEQQRRFRMDQLEELSRQLEALPDASDPDAGTHPELDREITEALAAGARAALHDVVLALHRMDLGRYAWCRRCGTALDAERLQVLPQLTLCPGCQRAANAAAD